MVDALNKSGTRNTDANILLPTVLESKDAADLPRNTSWKDDWATQELHVK